MKRSACLAGMLLVLCPLFLAAQPPKGVGMPGRPGRSATPPPGLKRVHVVVVQNKLALRDKEFGKQRTRTSSNGVRYGSEGLSAGRAAAEKVQFNRPIGSSNQPRQLA